MDITAVIGLVVVGMVLGFYLGRWHAEISRARIDMRRAWEGRRGYRRRDQ